MDALSRSLLPHVYAGFLQATMIPLVRGTARVAPRVQQAVQRRFMGGDGHHPHNVFEPPFSKVSHLMWLFGVCHISVDVEMKQGPRL